MPYDARGAARARRRSHRPSRSARAGAPSPPRRSARTSGPKPVGGGLGVVGDEREVGGDLELDVVEAIAGALAHPADLLGRRLRRRRADAVGPDHAGAVVEVEADDVRLAAGEPQHPWRPAADHDRRPRPLDRLRHALELRRPHAARTLEVDLTVGHRPLDDLDDVGQAADPLRPAGRTARPSSGTRSPATPHRDRARAGLR